MQKIKRTCSAGFGLCIWQFSIVNIYIISMQFHLLSIGCHIYSYSTVNRRTFDLLHKLQLLPAMDCSGTPHVVDHCSSRWSAVIPLYFHCTLTAHISSVYNALDFSWKMSVAAAECSWWCVCNWVAKGIGGSLVRTNFGILIWGMSLADVVAP